MKYISINIKTSGKNHEYCKIIEVGAVVEDTSVPYKFKDIPKFEAIIDHPIIYSEPTSISQNFYVFSKLDEYQRTRDVKAKLELKKKNNIYSEIEFVEAFHKFVWEHYVSNGEEYGSPFSIPLKSKPSPPVKVICAGKNFNAVDRLFLEKVPQMQKAIVYEQRNLDPSMLYIDWEKDNKLPSLELCKKRAEIQSTQPQTTIESAWNVVELLRRKYD